MWETLAHKRSEPPRLEIQPILKRIAFAHVPHLPRLLQYAWLAERISRETGEPVSAGTVKRWWNADRYDNGSVDSRHMDWARSRDPKRSAAANDNAGYRLPCRSEVIGVAA